MLYMGIDLGTSGVKVVLTASNGAYIDAVTVPLVVDSPHPLWQEQNPESWWVAVNTAINELRSKAKRKGSPSIMSFVSAIGLSGQMHGATLVDAQGKVLRPCILWCDGRCAAECAELEAAVPTSREITGNLMMPGFTAGKLLWVYKHEPEIFKQISKVLLPKDYVRLRMTGDYATDMSDASGTMWLNVAKRDWSDELLSATHLTREHMPRLYEGTEVTGKLLGDISFKWGMKRVSIVAGGGDNAAGAVGAGLRIPGQAMLSLGTSGVYFIVTQGCLSNTKDAVHSFCHALPKSWHLMSVMLSCAACLSWGAMVTGCASVEEFTQLAESAKNMDKRPLWFLPYLSGERTPHNNPEAKGVLFGLTLSHRRPEIAMAIIQGVTFALADGMDAVHRSGVTPDTITLIGGGSRSSLWRQLIADVSGFPVNFCTGGDVGPALGAARMAAVAMNPDTPPQDLLPPLPLQQQHIPNMEKHKEYLKHRHIFRNLYTTVAPLMSSKI